MKPLIIGEAPGKCGDPSTPIEGRIGARLAACCGLTFEEFLTTFDRVNLLDEQPQDAPKGMAFNVKAAGRVAQFLEHNREGIFGRPFSLLLGKRVAAAFRLTHVEYFTSIIFPNGSKVYVVPHPSGVNRWWNNWDNELEMIRFMRKITIDMREAE